MSEESTSVNTEVTETAKAEQIDGGELGNGVADELVKRDTHLRVLKESQKYKQRALEAEQKLEADQKAQLEEQGRYKELADTYKTRLEELTRREATTSLTTAVQSIASKEGCVDVNALMKLGNSELLQYDSAAGTVEGVELFVQDAKEKVPYLFKAGSTPKINAVTPGGALNNTSKHLNDMSQEEIMAELRKLEKQGVV